MTSRQSNQISTEITRDASDFIERLSLRTTLREIACEFVQNKPSTKVECYDRIHRWAKMKLENKHATSETANKPRPPSAAKFANVSVRPPPQRHIAHQVETISLVQSTWAKVKSLDTKVVAKMF
eukprot:PhF_6_TR17600/c0_g1_i1/m.26748